jgi:hypothetical protein
VREQKRGHRVMRVRRSDGMTFSSSQERDSYPSRVTVHVPTADIMAARWDARLDRAPAQYCPVARALCRALGVPLGWVTVGPYNVHGEA